MCVTPAGGVSILPNQEDLAIGGEGNDRGRAGMLDDVELEGLAIGEGDALGRNADRPPASHRPSRLVMG